jgi:hypothetical protein
MNSVAAWMTSHTTAGLLAIAALPGLHSVAFPYLIGCGLGGGDWQRCVTLRVFREIVTADDAIGPPPARLKLLHACDQWHSYVLSTTSDRCHHKLRPNTEGLVALSLKPLG